MILQIQELLTLPEYPSSPRLFSGIRVTRSLVLDICFVDCMITSLWYLHTLHTILITSLWYLQTLHTTDTTRFTPYLDLHLEIDSEGR